MSVAVAAQRPGEWMQVTSPASLVGCVGGPVPDAAREGRQKQRYAATGERLIAGCIPVRCTPDRTAAADGVEVLLISSRTGKGYCLPKGGWEDDETVELAAKRETVEEAGVRGELEEPIVGIFPFQSGKPEPDSVHQGRCIAHMFVLHVAEVLDVWPESERTRIWVPLAEAVQRCRHEWMRAALLTWVKRKGWSLEPLSEAARAQPLLAPLEAVAKAPAAAAAAAAGRDSSTNGSAQEQAGPDVTPRLSSVQAGRGGGPLIAHMVTPGEPLVP